MSSTRSKALVCLGVICFLWGTTWVASKQGVRFMPPLELAGIRQLIAGLIYIVYFSYKRVPWPKGREWYIIGVLCILNILATNGLTTWGVKYISAGLGAIISSTFPLWMVVIGLFSSKERIPVAALKGFLLGFAGICIIFFDHLKDFLDPTFLFGISISVTAAWSWALGTLFTKKEAQDFNPFFSLGFQMFFAGIILLPASFSTGVAIPFSAIPWQAWVAIAYLVLFGSVLAFAAYLYALQHLSLEQMSIYAYINPIVAVLLGSLLFGERLTIFIVAGGAVTLYGVYVINQAIRKMNSGAEPAEV